MRRDVRRSIPAAMQALVIYFLARHDRAGSLPRVPRARSFHGVKEDAGRIDGYESRCRPMERRAPHEKKTPLSTFLYPPPRPALSNNNTPRPSRYRPDTTNLINLILHRTAPWRPQCPEDGEEVERTLHQRRGPNRGRSGPLQADPNTSNPSRPRSNPAPSTSPDDSPPAAGPSPPR